MVLLVTMSDAHTNKNTGLQTFADEEVKEPRRFKVLLHNDDYTTMEFVIKVLRTVFKKTEAAAMDIMLTVHNKGVGVCGVYTMEVAETKIGMVRQMARNEGYPLRSSMEEV